ncbi:MAG: NADH-quinone oxidoreductase subunit NuoK [Nitrospinaceae bacterium]|jgi:NADH-quinone oxidoreductase subunit K|nr:NADH-quinone oxidoreductase subunit NuoK [Nitrospinaceae bacterium]MDP6477689.1 NADH-quinone oxidoreductase subunit NuoK [Nitrospinaceae bacterium]MDP6657855.1 NADH-quinone oxidoreductase subunit NuoK [Nitrospinaceae bacterium]MDP6712627.1 NADH-quinone oxidoreductase subunit NuoK [Nitrospinaceae bacterium]|tara:strand:+ start:3360 stop:3680 length:321 start_codon:yes stop_codon:yes gene_type:complete
MDIEMEMVPLAHYLFLSATLFVIGVVGVLVRRNAIVVFMSIEIMLNAVNISLIAFDRYLSLHDGQIFSFMVMCVAAAEVSVGLAIIIALFRNKPTINLDEFNIMKS